ncbi:MAG TPA: glycosyltransferase family 39 protein [Patescibacteria group bacterium]|nr:glycosyltransferase family 39 protein [Patescibacteria group bacterium]
MIARIFKQYRPLFLIVLGLIILIFSTYSQYGKTWDEEDTIAMGDHALSYYASFGKDTSYFSFYPQPAFYLTRGPVIEIVRALITSAAHNPSTNFYHLIIALFSVTGVIFIYLIALDITKKTSLAITGTALLLTLPRFYGDMFTNSKDIAPLYIMLICIYLSFKFFAGKRNLWFLILLGVLFGIKASLRVVQIYAYPFFALFAFIQELWIEKKKISTVLFHQIILGVFYLLALHLFQPYLLTHPIFGIKNMLLDSKKFPEVLPVLLNGKLYSSEALPWFYLPFYMVVTTPLIMLGLFALGNVLILLKKNSLPYLYLLILFWFPLFVVIVTHPTLYDAWRHFLFLYAPMSVIAIVGLWQTILLIPKKLHVYFWGVIAIGIALPLISMIKLHPYEYTYFNELVGGTRGTYNKYELDYWGESFKEATEWINIHQKQFASKDGNTYIKPCVHMLAQPYLAPHVIIDDALATVYYCINRPNLPNPGYNNLVHMIQRNGVPLNFIQTKYK